MKKRHSFQHYAQCILYSRLICEDTDAPQVRKYSVNPLTSQKSLGTFTFSPTVAPVRATSTPSETAITAGVEPPPSPAIELVTIFRQKHTARKSAANYWQTSHRKAVDRFKWRELRYQRILRELKASGAKSNAALQAELVLSKGQIRDLQSRIRQQKRTSQTL